MPPKFDLDAGLVRKLAKLLADTGLSEIEYAEGGKKIRCAAGGRPAPATPAASAAAPAPTGNNGEPSAKGTLVTAPMVGTVYLSPAPGEAPFVKAGDKVKAGETLLIIEAMKVMNPIKAPSGGTITSILAADSKPVEFGEVLLVIE